MPSGRHNRTKYAGDRNHPRANPVWRTNLFAEAFFAPPVTVEQKVVKILQELMLGRLTRTEATSQIEEIAR